MRRIAPELRQNCARIARAANRSGMCRGSRRKVSVNRLYVVIIGSCIHGCGFSTYVISGRAFRGGFAYLPYP